MAAPPASAATAFVVILEWLAHLATIDDPRDIMPIGENPCHDTDNNRTISFGHRRLVPFSNGVEDYEATLEDAVACVGSNCQKPILEEEEGESVPREGPVNLRFADLRGRRAGMLCNMCKGGRLTGPAVETDRNGNVVFVGRYVDGVRSGLCWVVDNMFSAALVGEVDGRGDFTGDNVALVDLNRREKAAYAYVGRFRRGVMEDAVRMAVEVDDGGKSSVNAFEVKRLRFVPIPGAEDEGTRHRFRPGDNLRNDEERISAQFAWIRNHLNTLSHDPVVYRPPPLGWLIGGGWEVPETLKGGHSVSLMWKYSGCRLCARFQTLMYGRIGQYRHPAWMACYPGSGSKAIENAVSMSTGHSIRGVQEISPKTPLTSSSLVKTHHQSGDSWMFTKRDKPSSEDTRAWLRRPQLLGWRLWNLNQLHGRAIVLIRNPYEAVLSQWSHSRLDMYNDNTTLYSLEDTTRSDLFRDFVLREIRLWEEVYMDFLTMGSEVLVIHKELYFKSPYHQTNLMLHFLGLRASPTRMFCTMRYPYDCKKRKSQPFEGRPFDADVTEAVEAAMDRVDAVLRDKGHEPLPRELYKWAMKRK